MAKLVDEQASVDHLNKIGLQITDALKQSKRLKVTLKGEFVEGEFVDELNPPPATDNMWFKSLVLKTANFDRQEIDCLDIESVQPLTD